MSDARHRILILLANGENRRLLSQTLSDRFDVATALRGGDVPDDESGPFDLCVIDGVSLRQHLRALARARERYAPIYLPVLLLADRQSTDFRAGELWNVIDDILYRPVERLELAARVQSLLRTRDLSLQARRLTGLYEQERAIAQRLQEAALPRLPPVLPGLRLDAVYRPADDAARVGGDWYDALRLGDGRVVVTIGDVSGSGLEAAVTMSQMRQVLRAVAHVHSDPALMLEAAERTIDEDPDRKQISAFVGVIDALTSEFVYASAGHPPPMLRRANGDVTVLPCDGLLLGTSVRLARRSQHHAFEEGELLVLYTDGVTEATRDPVAGEERLAHEIAALGTDEREPARRLADAMRTASAKDDVALVTIRHEPRNGSSGLLRWSFSPRDAERAKATQAAFRSALEARGLLPEAITIAETIFAELLGNVVRHAPGDVVVALDTDHQVPVLHVLDRGAGFQYFPRLPHDVLSERGRGLYIVSKLAEEFTIARRTGAGSHARVVLATVPKLDS